MSLLGNGCTMGKPCRYSSFSMMDYLSCYFAPALWGQWFYRRRGTGRHRARYHVRAESAKKHTPAHLYSHSSVTSSVLALASVKPISQKTTITQGPHYRRMLLFYIQLASVCLVEMAAWRIWAKPQKPVVYHCELAQCSTGGYLVEASTANVASFSPGSGWDAFWFPALNQEAGCQLFMTYLTLSSVHMADRWREWCPTEPWNLSPCPKLDL